ncbi:hypothetical protein LTSEWAN_3133 [Salmonella enterica subsp. enterica serovar Wandsworth str. A4-580]|uniref:Uncharacterized protein n=2 Tax=Salmonella enterica I TaxID=59201 RepID=A0A6C8H1Z2_SALET|nr:hypothetical protein LTSEUGA_2794 [Salmonella enterica subsp. enterica serovar Uganda str. R8-3404]EHD02337.1 hypothetical protein LTSEWAN_3133 [Salmonella enterica subsp. enterica serovar Wandsworth str. A4-580]ETO90193.1 hypothetical protein Sesv_0959 [Salmonella enterica subsp. enterica serovar Virchow str. SVQ1]
MARWKMIVTTAQYYGIKTEENGTVHCLVSYGICQ